MIKLTKPDQRGVSAVINFSRSRRDALRKLVLLDEGPPDRAQHRRRRSPETEQSNSMPPGEKIRVKTMRTEMLKTTEHTEIQIKKWGSKMTEERSRVALPFRKTMTSVLALAVALGAAAPAYAAITNTGSVTASTPDGGTVSDTSSESVTVATPDPEFNIVKSVSSVSIASGDDAANPDGGDVVTYNYAVTNSGNVTIDASTLAITDPGPTFDGTALAGTWTFSPTYVSGDANTDNEINPGETWNYSQSYTLTQADVDNSAGVTDGVENTITTATADSLGGDPATFDTGASTLTANTTIPENGAVSLTKIATRNGSTEDDGSVTAYTEGEDIIYLFTVENTGNVTLSSMTVSETAFVAPSGSSAPTITCTISGTDAIATLAPGATETCTATYTVLATDL